MTFGTFHPLMTKISIPFFSILEIGIKIYHTLPDNSMVHHISRSLTQAETNYSQIEKEVLALIFALQRIHNMLFGC